MNQKKSVLGLTLAFVLYLSFLPTLSTSSTSGTQLQFLTPSISSKSDTYIEEIPYVWQEINGFCHWASVSMALQHIGLPLNLYDVFALTGIGFSSVYVSYQDIQMMLAGPVYRQLYQVQYLESFLEIEYTVMVGNSTEEGQMFAQAMDAWNLDYQTLDGATAAHDTLCQSIDAGYPLLLWVDPYYLPAKDYDILRDLNLHSSDTGSGHAILAVGYNKTSDEVWIMDPGVGALGDNVTYPSDGRWHYSIDYTNLSLAREAVGFGAIQITPTPNLRTLPPIDYVALISQRLLGELNAYEIFNVDPSIVSCGANAFSRIRIDLIPTNLVNYLSRLESEEQVILFLYEHGILLEQMLTLQHLSYRSALSCLPKFLSEIDFTLALSQGQLALNHFSALSTNASLTTFDHTSYHSLIKDTFWGIAEAYEQHRNIHEAVHAFYHDIAQIQRHLTGIAQAWEALGNELRSLVTAIIYNPIVFPLLATAVAALIITPSVIVLRARKRSEIANDK
jgi:hypothetical protein